MTNHINFGTKICCCTTVLSIVETGKDSCNFKSLAF